MFKTIQIIVMAALCLNFSAITQENKAIDVTSKGIQIGQKVPDITITNLHNYKDKNGKPATTAKLSDFKGKLLILDFWATWCAPCVAMIPRMDALQKQFKDQIQFLSVTYQNEKEVLPFLSKFEQQQGKQFDIPIVTGDKELKRLFPHVYLPHYIWIDQTGTVRAITDHEEITEGNIEKALNTQYAKYNLKRKIDMKVAYDKSKPFLINNNGGEGGNILYHSVLTSFSPGINSMYKLDRGDSIKRSKLVSTNVTLAMLYNISFYKEGYFGKNRLIIKSKRAEQISEQYSALPPQEYLLKFGYCYELLFEPSFKRDLFDQMGDDLKKLFPQFTANIELVDTICLALIRTSSHDKLKSTHPSTFIELNKFGAKLSKAYLSQLIARLEQSYLQHLPYPLQNETNYQFPVDLDIKAEMADVDSLNEALKKYDLKFVKIKRPVKVLVIRDTE